MRWPQLSVTTLLGEIQAMMLAREHPVRARAAGRKSFRKSAAAGCTLSL